MLNPVFNNDGTVTITVNGITYLYKKSTFKFVAEVQRFLNSGVAFRDEKKLQKGSDVPTWKDVERDWKKFLEMIFEKYDDKIHMADLTPREALEISAGFFSYHLTAIPESQRS
jgi:hypothetical protein